MGSRRVKWSKKALKAFYDQALWYKINKGEQFVQTFTQNIHDTIESIAAMPSIGRLEQQMGKRQYYSFPSHPKCRIYYWYNEEVLYITGLRFMLMG